LLRAASVSAAFSIRDGSGKTGSKVERDGDSAGSTGLKGSPAAAVSLSP